MTRVGKVVEKVMEKGKTEVKEATVNTTKDRTVLKKRSNRGAHTTMTTTATTAITTTTTKIGSGRRCGRRVRMSAGRAAISGEAEKVAKVTKVT